MGRPKGTTKGGKVLDIVKQIPKGKSGKKTIFNDDEDDELDNIPGDVDDIFAAKKAAKKTVKNNTIIQAKGKNVVKKATRSSKRNLDEIDSNEEEDSDDNNQDLKEDNSEQEEENKGDNDDDYEDDDNFGVNDEDIDDMGNFMNEYDEEEDAEDLNGDSDEDNEDAPEIVKGDTDEILAMKLWHEQLVASTGNKKSKKQKKDNKIDIATSSSKKIISEEDEIDADLLNALDEFDDNNSYSNEDSEEEENDNDNDEDKNELENILNSKIKIDKNANRSRLIGNIEVTVLDSNTELDPLSMFKMSKSAIDFTKTINDKQQRVRYASFVGAKKAGPSKKFRSR